MAIITSLSDNFSRQSMDAAIRWTALACVIVLSGCVERVRNPDIDTETDSTDTTTETDTDSTPFDSATSDTASDTPSDSDTQIVLSPGALAINEVMSNNEGVVLDNQLETEDWIELIAVGSSPVNISGYSIADSDGTKMPLPSHVLNPGETVLLYADNESFQGVYHLGMKLDSDGERIVLYDSEDAPIDLLDIPPLEANTSFARYPDGSGAYAECRYATPGVPNGESCVSETPPGMETIPFASYQWPPDIFAPSGPVVINELTLHPAGFIELENILDTEIDLTSFTLEIAPHAPGQPWPESGDGIAIFPDTLVLQAKERLSLPVTNTEIASLLADPRFEGVVTLFNDAVAVDRVDFMSWPEGSALARIPDGTGRFTYCDNTTMNGRNECVQTPSREVTDRLRHLRTPTDFDRLAEGGARLGIGSGKFVVDLDGGNAVHLLSSWDWDLHYTFVREVINGEPSLDRCIPEQEAAFNSGWGQFSQENYYTVEGRRYLLGTLSHHSNADLRCVEYTFGDAISAEQMMFGYFEVAAHTDTPTGWVLRPQDTPQVEKARTIEGQLPIVGPTAPFANVTYQTLTEGVGYGTLQYIDAQSLSDAVLGPDVIVVTNDVPNDIPYVGGLITEAFQTPLSHVNVLSKSRNTPNIALPNAHLDGRIAPLINQLVKLEVFATHFEISLADPAEAQAHWDSLIPDGPLQTPLLDTAVRGIVPLGPDVGFEHRGSIGAKAAQLSEMTRITSAYSRCEGTLPLPTPEYAFAIPVVHYLEHFQRSGAQGLYEQLSANPEFTDNPTFRASSLAHMRELIMETPVDASLLTEVTAAVRIRYDEARVRFRSSSNIEDLSDFNGAGLYTSVSARIGDAERPIEDAMRTVWASLWNERAFDERRQGHIDQHNVAMGILVHQAYLSEEANGVAVSRDITDVDRGDRYYVNVQAGEASVANPAPAVTTEQFIYQWPSRLPTLRMMAQSSLIDTPVLRNEPIVDDSLIRTYGEIEGETRTLMCALRAVHTHFKQLLDPANENRLFAMEIEFKLEHNTRNLAVKQTRPYSFGNLPVPEDCRQL